MERSEHFHLLPNTYQKELGDLPELIGDLKCVYIKSRYDHMIFSSYWEDQNTGTLYYFGNAREFENTYDMIEVYTVYELTGKYLEAAQRLIAEKKTGIRPWFDKHQELKDYKKYMAWLQEEYPCPIHGYSENQTIEYPQSFFYVQVTKGRYYDDYHWVFEISELDPWKPNPHTYEGEQYYFMCDGYYDPWEDNLTKHPFETAP